MVRIISMGSLLALQLMASVAWAADPVQEQRSELMKGARDAAKTVGGMLKGELDFDAAAAMESFQVWADVAARTGDLFPEGSETGYDTEARETIWTDREGFNQKLSEFTQAVDGAIEASPQSIEELKASAGPVFKTCKGCHEGYRIEDES
ncbi:MAG: cytochrome c [Xanthomonadales bacterium]|nr:cytochrome c [Gammaproteobacteria bacterium]NND56986.1 cytochrome c [Xanthomonadales bacterium]NNK51944.1 cytochrome c [Xanthomonadales bacterium]